MDFHVEAVWDNAARVFRSEGNIAGLHIEAETLAEFRKALSDVAPGSIRRHQGAEAGRRG